MKKLVKKLLLTFSFGLACLVMAKATNVQAAEVPEKVRVYYTGQDSFDVKLDHYGDSIDNLKVNSKNALVKITSIDKSQNQDENNTIVETNKQSIGIYTKKFGTYTVTFDIVDENGKKISSKKTIVYCYESPITIKIDGKHVSDNITAKSGKVTVSVASKNKISKLQYGKAEEVENGSKAEGNYDYTVDYVYKTFKSGSKITFNAIPESSERISDYSSEYYVSKYQYLWSGFTAYTPIKVTYKDQYTGNNEVFLTYAISKIVE